MFSHEQMRLGLTIIKMSTVNGNVHETHEVFLVAIRVFLSTGARAHRATSPYPQPFRVCECRCEYAWRVSDRSELASCPHPNKCVFISQYERRSTVEISMGHNEVFFVANRKLRSTGAHRVAPSCPRSAQVTERELEHCKRA